jgi:hypothetical protein
VIMAVYKTCTCDWQRWVLCWTSKHAGAKVSAMLTQQLVCQEHQHSTLTLHPSCKQHSICCCLFENVLLVAGSSFFWGKPVLGPVAAHCICWTAEKQDRPRQLRSFEQPVAKIQFSPTTIKLKIVHLAAEVSLIAPAPPVLGTCCLDMGQR